jgi:hypothetical protein
LDKGPQTLPQVKHRLFKSSNDPGKRRELTDRGTAGDELGRTTGPPPTTQSDSQLKILPIGVHQNAGKFASPVARAMLLHEHQSNSDSQAPGGSSPKDNEKWKESQL